MKPKTVLLAIVLLASLGYAGWNLKKMFSASDLANAASVRWMVCSETKKAFQVDLRDLDGKAPPFYSPYSKKDTAYPAELCFWTNDGKTKDEPTPVLMNNDLGIAGPTFCPDCGRLVVGHNPRPQPGGKVPPTKSEWESRRRP